MVVDRSYQQWTKGRHTRNVAAAAGLIGTVAIAALWVQNSFVSDRVGRVHCASRIESVVTCIT